MSEPKFYVYCRQCDKYFQGDDETVEFLNIEEDILGRDLMAFVCPLCKQQRKSLVVAKH